MRIISAPGKRRRIFDSRFGRALCLLLGLFFFLGEELRADVPAEARGIKADDILTPPLTFPFRRWDFFEGGHVEMLAKWAKDPKYDAFGLPKFKSIWERPLGLFDKELATASNYGRRLNKEFAQEVQKDTKRWRKILTEDTIRRYRTGGYSSYSKNPKAKLGKLEWHHDRTGYQLVLASEHRPPKDMVPKSEHGAKTHIGGRQLYGADAKQRVLKNNKLASGILAKRWGSFVLFDIGVSSARLFFLEHERRLTPYAAEAGISVFSGGVAAATEFALWKSPLLTFGTAPLYVGGVPISLGGPAAWVSLGVYMAANIALSSLWDEYQRREAARVERLCRDAEFEVRRGLLEAAVRGNTARLRGVLD